MPKLRSPEEKVSDWYTVFNAVRAELTTQVARDSLTNLQTRQPGENESPEDYLRSQLAVAQSISRHIAANDRMAALVAAMLTSGGGARVVPLETVDE